MTRAVVLGLAIVGVLDGAQAHAQVRARDSHRFSASGGLSWLGGYPLGSSAATLRRNEPSTTTPSGFTLFQADTSLERAFGVEGRFGFAIARRLSGEVGGAFSQPRLAARITEDAESDPIVLSDQRLMQLSLEGSVIWQLSGIDLGSHARPYLIGGAGYLRQIDADRVKVETGTVAHAGGGVRYWLRGNDSTRRAFGVRGEARLQIRSGGLDFEDKTRVQPTIHVLGFVGF